MIRFRPLVFGLLLVPCLLLVQGMLGPAASAAPRRPPTLEIVTIPPLPAARFTFDGQPHPATATAIGAAGERLMPVTVEYALAGGSVPAPVNAGTYVVTARFAGSANYVAASGSGTVTIGKAAPTVTWPAPSSIVYGTPLGTAQLSASASVAGSFAYSPGFNTVLAAGSGRALSATFIKMPIRRIRTDCCARAAGGHAAAEAPRRVRKEQRCR